MFAKPRALSIFKSRLKSLVYSTAFASTWWGGIYSTVPLKVKLARLKLYPHSMFVLFIQKKKKVKRGENGRVCFVHLFHVGAVYTE